MLCEVTHSAGCNLANYHIVIFERSYVTVRNICASALTCRLTVCAVDSLLLINVDMPN